MNKKELIARNIAITRMVLYGGTLESVGKEVGLSKERVRVITYKTLRDGRRLRQSGVLWGPGTREARRHNQYWLGVLRSLEKQLNGEDHE